MKTSSLLGRIILWGILRLQRHTPSTKSGDDVEYAGAKGVPAPELAVKATGAVLLAGGTSILLGIKPKLGAAAIAGFLAGVSPTMHDFWNQEHPQQRQGEMVNFMKNLALLGAAVTLMGVDEPWPASVPVAQPSKTERIRRFARQCMAA